MRQTSTCEWAPISEHTVVVADASRAWLADTQHYPAPMTGPGACATTRKLLDGAIGAAWARAPRGPQPVMTRLRWVWRLAGYYHLTHATPRLMAIAAARFAASGRSALAAWAAEKAREEHGHDLLALRDIATLGYPAQRVVQRLRPPSAAALIDRFTADVHADDPIACVGYAYTLERLALTVGAADIAAIARILPPGVDATRCMRVHSAVGSDAAHVDDDIAMIAGLSASERAAVVAAVYATATLCLRPVCAPIGEAELAAILTSL